MFELTKMNMSQTGVHFFYSLLSTNSCRCFVGYKLCKHIATALRACSQAIHNSLDQYNAATSSVSPPCPNLSWDDVVEYAFLADLDLLRGSCQDVRDHP